MSDDLKDLTLPSSGVVLKIRRIPTLLLDDFWRNLPLPPAPPMQKVDYGDGKEHEEPNPGHPDYARTIDRYDYEVGLRMLEFAALFGVECEVDQEAVARVRGWAEKAGIELPGDDKLVYVTRILATGPDLRAIQEAVFGRVQPTEKEIGRKADRFQGEVPGS